jgi:hypothetical protein
MTIETRLNCIRDLTTSPISSKRQVIGLLGRRRIAGNWLRLRITFMEAMVSTAVERQLKKELPQIEIEVFTPVLPPTDFNTRRY